MTTLKHHERVQQFITEHRKLLRAIIRQLATPWDCAEFNNRLARDRELTLSQYGISYPAAIDFDSAAIAAIQRYVASHRAGLQDREDHAIQQRLQAKQAAEAERRAAGAPYINKTDLLARGWTRTLIANYLGPPEFVDTIRRGIYQHKSHLYSLARVRKMERRKFFEGRKRKPRSSSTQHCQPASRLSGVGFGA